MVRPQSMNIVTIKRFSNLLGLYSIDLFPIESHIYQICWTQSHVPLMCDLGSSIFSQKMGQPQPINIVTIKKLQGIYCNHKFPIESHIKYPRASLSSYLHTNQGLGPPWSTWTWNGAKCSRWSAPSVTAWGLPRYQMSWSQSSQLHSGTEQTNICINGTKLSFS